MKLILGFNTRFGFSKCYTLALRLVVSNVFVH